MLQAHRASAIDRRMLEEVPEKRINNNSSLCRKIVVGEKKRRHMVSLCSSCPTNLVLSILSSILTWMVDKILIKTILKRNLTVSVKFSNKSKNLQKTTKKLLSLKNKTNKFAFNPPKKKNLF